MCQNKDTGAIRVTTPHIDSRSPGLFALYFPSNDIFAEFSSSFVVVVSLDFPSLRRRQGYRSNGKGNYVLCDKREGETRERRRVLRYLFSRSIYVRRTTCQCAFPINIFFIVPRCLLHRTDNSRCSAELKLDEL